MDKNNKATRRDVGEDMDGSVLDVTYALMQQLVPGQLCRVKSYSRGID